MATRHALRLVQHRFCSSGKLLGQEKKAVENVFIKKMEQEKLGKLACKQGEETSEAAAAAAAAAAAGGLGGPIITYGKKRSSSSSSSSSSNSNSGGLSNFFARVVKVAKIGLYDLLMYGTFGDYPHRRCRRCRHPRSSKK